MSWQDAKREAEGLAGDAKPSSVGEEIEVVQYATPEAYRAAGGHREWSWEFHRDVTQALKRIYSRRGFKVRVRDE